MPDSAAGVARQLGEPRQRINHHVRELAKAGLLVEAGERRKGNFVEQLYESAAGTFVAVAAPHVGRRRAAAGHRRPGLARSTSSTSESGCSATPRSLLDRAAFDGEEIPAVAVEATVRFADAEARAAFLDDYLALTARLIEQHATADGDAFTVALVAHPTTEESP